MTGIDPARFADRGARGCGNSHYRLRLTTCCGAPCVEDEELSDLYYDGGDLTRVVGLWAVQGCPVCGGREWELETLADGAGAPPAWAWAAA